MASDFVDTVYGPLSSELMEARLADVCVGDGGVQTGPFGSQLHAEDYVLHGTPIITVEHLGDNHLIHENLPRVSASDRERLAKYSLRAGDIVFSRVGSVDRRALVHPEEDGWLFSGRCLRVRPDPEKISPAYLSWFLGLPGFQAHIRRIAVGATMPSLNTKILSDVPVFYHPSVADQERIADVLGKLDDKIELNRRMNRTLERIAAAIFKSWFIDFDPVHAKTEGRDSNLPVEIADLFPDSFEDSDLGPIPKGWKLKPIGDVVRCVGGATPSTRNPKFWEDGKHPFVTPKDMSSLQSPVIFDSERHITDAGVEKISSKQLPVGTVILSSRAPIGYLGVATVPVSVNQGVIAMICDGDLPNLYILYWTAANMDLIKSRAGGTTFAEISKRSFRPIPVLLPATPVLDTFMNNVAQLHERITLNVRQNRRLASLRDALLPKLLSGEIELPSVEAIAEEVTS